MAKKFIVVVREWGFVGPGGEPVETEAEAQRFDDIQMAHGASKDFAAKNTGAECVPTRVSE